MFGHNKKVSHELLAYGNHHTVSYSHIQPWTMGVNFHLSIGWDSFGIILCKKKKLLKYSIVFCYSISADKMACLSDFWYQEMYTIPMFQCPSMVENFSGHSCISLSWRTVESLHTQNSILHTLQSCFLFLNCSAILLGLLV